MKCAFCGESLEIEDRVSRKDVCPHCGRDVRCCKNCTFYDPAAYNECREVAAERVVDKERANFCDYFSPGNGKRVRSGGARGAKAALEALFKKQ